MKDQVDIEEDWKGVHYSNQGAKIQKHGPVFVNYMEWNFLICLMLYRVCKSVALDLKDNRPSMHL